MAETQAEAAWLYTTLTGDAVLDGLVTGVFEGIAPAEQDYPFVTFHHQGGSDIHVVGPVRYATTGLWLVRGVTDEPGFGTLVPIEKRIEAVLQAASGENVNGTVFAAVREAPFRLDDTQDGTKQLGGQFRLLTRRAA